MLVDAGRNWVLRVISQQLTPLPLALGLYTNNVAWSRATLFGDLTEPSMSGYARSDCGPWQPPTILSGGEGSITAPSIAFHNNSAAAVVVVGFFFMVNDGSFFVGGDAFAAPLTIPGNGGVLNVFPQLIDTTYP